MAEEIKSQLKKRWETIEIVPSVSVKKSIAKHCFVVLEREEDNIVIDPSLDLNVSVVLPKKKGEEKLIKVVEIEGKPKREICYKKVGWKKFWLTVYDDGRVVKNDFFQLNERLPRKRFDKKFERGLKIWKVYERSGSLCYAKRENKRAFGIDKINIWRESYTESRLAVWAELLYQILLIEEISSEEKMKSISDQFYSQFPAK